ncbi:MAG: lysophospholipid acyltransferase family protein [Candidatus Omnitrophota bacterium]
MAQYLVHKNLSRMFRRYALFFMRGIVRWAPFWVFKAFCPFFIFVGNFFFRKKKMIVRENLLTAFEGEKTPEEVGDLVGKYFRHTLSGMVDFIYFLDRPAKIVEKVQIEGVNYLDEALSRRQGVIMLSAHFGSFGLMFLRMGLGGYKTNFIIRPMRDKQMGNFITSYAAQHGVNTIYALPFRQCVEMSLKALRRNELLFILLDQNYSEEAAVFVDFFGRPAATATGPVVFSARTQAPILPVFITGNMKCGYKITIDAPVVFEQKDPELHLECSTAQLTKLIEDRIRLFPCEWGGWMHRRWKTRKES